MTAELLLLVFIIKFCGLPSFQLHSAQWWAWEVFQTQSLPCLYQLHRSYGYLHHDMNAKIISWWLLQLEQKVYHWSTLNKEFVYGRHGASSLSRRSSSCTAATETRHLRYPLMHCSTSLVDDLLHTCMQVQTCTMCRCFQLIPTHHDDLYPISFCLLIEHQSTVKGLKTVLTKTRNNKQIQTE